MADEGVNQHRGRLTSGGQLPAPLLPPPPRYTPFRSGRYDVSPGLSRFGRSVGGERGDAAVFQADRTFSTYQAAKHAARRSRPSRHVLTGTLDARVAARVARFVTGRLAAEYPTVFAVSRPPGATRVTSALTNEKLTLGSDLRLVGASCPAPVDPPYAGALDALACQVQEDLAVVTRSPNGRHRLAAAHVCFPNGWAPEEMVGRDFAGLHAAVPGMAAMNRRGGDDFARLMVSATDGLVRFAWGIAFDDQLDHHPATPRSAFDPARPAAWVRVERQTIWGFPDIGAALFTIRTYLYDCADVCRDPVARDRLVSAVRSMSAAALAYKGLGGCRDELLRWLAGIR